MDLSQLVSGFGGVLWAGLALLLVFIIIVPVHEFGHYIVGRWCGIHAEVFSLGFGRPLLTRTDKHGTRWQIALVPLGGYVKFLGDADAASRPDSASLTGLSDQERRHSMQGAPIWARSATVLAGPLFNMALTLILFFFMVLASGVPSDQPVVGTLRPVPFDGPGLQLGDRVLALNGQDTPDMATYFKVADKIGPMAEVSYKVERAGTTMVVLGPHPLPAVADSVVTDSAAAKAGLQKGDVVIAAGGAVISTFAQLPDIVEQTKGAPLALSVWRNGKPFDVTLNPTSMDLPKADGSFETRWMIGLSGGVLFDPEIRTPSLWEAAQYSWTEAWIMAKINLSGLAHIATGAISSCNLSSPIGMAKVAGQAAHDGLRPFVQTLALFSLFIGLANLLPIPVLDGGHLVFHLYEAVVGRVPSDRAMQILMSLGLGILIFLMLFAFSNDLFLCR